MRGQQLQLHIHNQDPQINQRLPPIVKGDSGFKAVYSCHFTQWNIIKSTKKELCVGLKTLGLLLVPPLHPVFFFVLGLSLVCGLGPSWAECSLCRWQFWSLASFATCFGAQTRVISVTPLHCFELAAENKLRASFKDTEWFFYSQNRSSYRLMYCIFERFSTLDISVLQEKDQMLPVFQMKANASFLFGTLVSCQSFIVWYKHLS